MVVDCSHLLAAETHICVIMYETSLGFLQCTGRVARVYTRSSAIPSIATSVVQFVLQQTEDDTNTGLCSADTGIATNTTSKVSSTCTAPVVTAACQDCQPLVRPNHQQQNIFNCSSAAFRVCRFTDDFAWLCKSVRPWGMYVEAKILRQDCVCPNAVCRA